MEWEAASVVGTDGSSADAGGVASIGSAEVTKAARANRGLLRDTKSAAAGLDDVIGSLIEDSSDFVFSLGGLVGRPSEGCTLDAGGVDLRNCDSSGRINGLGERSFQLRSSSFR